MEITLKPEIEALVESKVRTGRYRSASEMVSEGLRLLRARDELQAIQRQALQHEIQIGLKQLDNGEALDAEDVFAELLSESEKVKVAS